jgi:hypothetical protein
MSITHACRRGRRNARRIEGAQLVEAREGRLELFDLEQLDSRDALALRPHEIEHERLEVAAFVIRSRKPEHGDTTVRRDGDRVECIGPQVFGKAPPRARGCEIGVRAVEPAGTGAAAIVIDEVRWSPSVGSPGLGLT